MIVGCEMGCIIESSLPDNLEQVHEETYKSEEEFCI